jgi:eukaryotic-like serine/threonine-protein kinase
MTCLDEETILAFCQGDLAPAARARAEEHVAACDECRTLVSAVARSSIVAPDRAISNDPAMAPTTPVGSGSPRLGPAASPVSPGDILAEKYVVEQVLGAGGMGIVVAARHTQLEQRVALKFLLPVACEIPGAVARFLREGKAAARITSEHVARVIDTGVLDNGAPYLVMEYLEGKDLGAVAQERGKLPAHEAVEYVLQACEAIVEAHELGIVHRDLKPPNLFLSRRADGTPLVKVLDFGISKVDGGSRSQLTSASVMMGSPRYMSPEQMVSAKDVDARTDIWSLGVILYELVTGKPVWEADTLQGLCALIASSPPPRLRAHAPDAPRALEEVVLRCLAKPPQERIASVADLALALAPIAPPSATTSIERILRVGRRVPRALAAAGSVRAPVASSSPTWPFAVAALAAVLLAAAGGFAWKARTQDPTADVAAAPVADVASEPAADTGGDTLAEPEAAHAPDAAPASVSAEPPSPRVPESSETRTTATSPRRPSRRPSAPAAPRPAASPAPTGPAESPRPAAAPAPAPDRSAHEPNRALTDRK